MGTTGATIDPLLSGASESNELLRKAIEQAPVAIALTLGPDFIFESINPPMLEIIGRRHKDEVIGRRLEDVLPRASGAGGDVDPEAGTGDR